MSMKGYKVFNPDWACNGFKYKVGETYEMDDNIEMCERGFHFCKNLIDCFNYYEFDPKNKVAEVLALGKIIEKGNKCCTNKIKIVKEISWEKVLSLVNTGKGNSGHSNNGNSNSGNFNSGHRNSGSFNNGHANSGSSNIGNFNSGHSNSGDRNTGVYNNGIANSGESNDGSFNTGCYNIGSFNTGNYNVGYWNTGDFNLTDHSAGCFCTEQQKLIFFDKASNITYKQWKYSEAYSILQKVQFEPTHWVIAEDMTDKEKENHPDYIVTGGYLKVCDTSKAFIDWWDSLSEREKEIIKSIPNFDVEKFYKITGIDVRG